MEQHLFRYQIIRHIADLRRMEPQNFGIIVQGKTGIRCQFNPYFGRKPGFDLQNLRLWKDFFRTEIEGKAVPLFQPDRLSIEFLEYLQDQGSGNYSVTRPLEIVLTTSDLESVAKYLYETLVRITEDKEAVSNRPVTRFVGELESRKLINNPHLLKNRGFDLPGARPALVQYQYTRNHGSDMPVLIQSVPWSNQIQETLGRLESALALTRTMQKLRVKAEVSIVMDVPPNKAKDEDQGRVLLREQFEEARNEFENSTTASGDVNVADNPQKVVKLSESIEKDIRDVEQTEKTRSQSGDLALK